MPHSRLVVGLLQTLPVSLPGQSNHPEIIIIIIIIIIMIIIINYWMRFL